jgi:tagatose-1,6-bisphosphate aldolase non-catalytic subunit AgaZ/GatZ
MAAKHRYVLVAPSAARTATWNVPVKDNQAKYADIVVDITAWTAGSLTVTLQGYDSASGKYYTILASTALAAAATTVLRVGPALTVAANSVANFALPKELRVLLTHADATSITYSVGMSLIE